MAFGVSSALVLALITSLGPTEPGVEAQISWEAPLECPSTAWVGSRIEAYLGRRLEGEGQFPIVVAGRVHGNDSSFTLELTTEVDGLREQHRLEHHDCATLIELAASLAAIAIDPLTLAEQSLRAPPDPRYAPSPVVGVPIQRPTRPARAITTAPSEPEPPTPLRSEARLTRPEIPQPQSETPLLDLRTIPVERAPSDRPRRPPVERHTRALIAASGGLVLNLFPNPAPEVHGSLGIEHGSRRAAFRAEVAGGVVLAGRFRSADGSAGGDIWGWDLALRPCGVPRWRVVELRACAAVGAGQMRAQGVGVGDGPLRVHPWVWLAAEAGVGFAVHGNVALFIDLTASFNLLRPNFDTSSPEAFFLTPAVSGHARAGIELRFPGP